MKGPDVSVLSHLYSEEEDLIERKEGFDCNQYFALGT